MDEDELQELDRALPEADGLAEAVLGTAEVSLFENLYLAYATEARGVARAILGDPELAADAVHNGFLEILRYLVAGRRWHDPAAARATVLRNVRWAALKLHRSRRRLAFGAESADEPGDDRVWARAEARALCEEVVSRLRPNHRAAIQLRYVEGLSEAEAAQRLAVSVGVFTSRLHRAVEAARRAARSHGLAPQAVLFVDRLHRILRQRPRVALARAAPFAQTLAVVAATVLAVQAAAAESGSVQALASDPPVVSARSQVTLDGARSHLDGVDTSQILDAIQLPSGGILAVGRGLGCGCLRLFRSLDGGASWTAAAGPAGVAAAPRLAVTADYPRNPELVVDLETGGAVQVSPRFGAPFATPTQAVVRAPSLRHALGCAAAEVSLYCAGHGVAGDVAGARAGAGAILVTGGRILHFQRVSGVLCSADGGIRWAARCPQP